MDKGHLCPGGDRGQQCAHFREGNFFHGHSNLGLSEGLLDAAICRTPGGK
jgi:hypothetical protein